MSVDRPRSHEERRLRVRDVNSHVTCRLCKGYLIDASTIQKCLHSFCRSCLVRFLASNHACPVCGVLLNRSEPLLNVRLDRTLQNLVYKLVPGLFKDEMQRRHHRYFSPKGTAPAGQSSSTSVINPQNYSHIVTEDEKISVCLRRQNDLNSQDEKKDCRFLLCPAMATVMHLKKMIRCKFDLAAKFQIEFSCPGASNLTDDLTLMDVSYLQQWTKTQPMSMHYTVFKDSSEDDQVQIEPPIYVISDDEEDESEIVPVELPLVEPAEEVTAVLPTHPAPPPDLITSCEVSSTEEPFLKVVQETSESSPADENGNVCPTSLDVKMLDKPKECMPTAPSLSPKPAQTTISASSQPSQTTRAQSLPSASVSPVTSNNSTRTKIKPESPFVKRYFTSSNSKSSKNGAPSFPTRPGNSFPGMMPSFSSKNSRKLSSKSKPSPGNVPLGGGLRTILSNGVVRNLSDGIAPAANNIIMKAIPVVPFVKNGNSLPSSISFHLVPCSALTSSGQFTFLDSSSASKFALGGVPVLGTNQSILLKPVVSAPSATKTTEIKPKTTAASNPTSSLVNTTSQVNSVTTSVASVAKLSLSSTVLPVHASNQTPNPVSVCPNTQPTEKPILQTETEKNLACSNSSTDLPATKSLNTSSTPAANPRLSANQRPSVRLEPKPGNYSISWAKVPRAPISEDVAGSRPPRKSVPVSIEHILPTLLPTLKSESVSATPQLKPKTQEPTVPNVESFNAPKVPSKRPNNFDVSDEPDSTPIKKLKLMCNGIDKIDPQRRLDQENFLRTFATNSPILPSSSSSKVKLSPGTPPDGGQCRYMHRKHHIMKSLSISSSVTSPTEMNHEAMTP